MAEPESKTSDLMDAREGVPTGEQYEMTPAEKKARNRRNLAVAFGVLAFILIVYFTTILRLTQNVSGGAAS